MENNASQSIDSIAIRECGAILIVSLWVFILPRKKKGIVALIWGVLHGMVPCGIAVLGSSG